MNNLARPAGAGVRARPGVGRQGVLRRSRAVADQFLPTSVVGYAPQGRAAYPYNPDEGEALLQQAGLKLPVRGRLLVPDERLAAVHAGPEAQLPRRSRASLEKSGFKVTFHSGAVAARTTWARVQSGKAQLFLLGWTGDFGDPANFLNVHFGQPNAQFGFNNHALFNLLAAGPTAETEPRQADCAVPAGEHPGDEVPADGAVRAQQAGTRVPEERERATSRAPSRWSRSRPSNSGLGSK